MPRILVVQRALDVDDIEQVVAPDGDAALACLDADDFDAVVLDLALPPLDGWCVLARVGCRSPRPRMIAAAPTVADVDRARRLGAEAYLHDWSALGAAIRDTLSTSSSLMQGAVS